MKLFLKPVGLGAENLNLISFDSNNDGWSIVLGRNVATGLDSPCTNIQYVSRNHVQITLRLGRVYMSLVTKQKGVVHLNHEVFEDVEREIVLGDTISMLGSLNYFNYEYTDEISSSLASGQTGKLVRSSSYREPSKTVEIALIDLSGGHSSPMPARPVSVMSPAPKPVAASTATSTAGKTNSTTDSSHDVINKLIRQYECSICYETMACAFSLSPCGDSFCYTCISDWSEKNNCCPMCQSAFNLSNSMLNKIVDNGIREILSTDKDMLKEWEDRVTEGLSAWKKSLQQPPPPQAVSNGAKSSNIPAKTSRDESSKTVIMDLFGMIFGVFFLWLIFCEQMWWDRQVRRCPTREAEKAPALTL